jgi:hypothetical protein
MKAFMRWICVLLLLVAACDKTGPEPSSPTGGGKAPAAKPSAEPAAEGDETIVPPPDKPGYEKPE